MANKQDQYGTSKERCVFTIMEEERKFMEARAEDLLRIIESHSGWVRKAPAKMSTHYHVVVPEDGEDYWEPMTLMKISKGYLLVQHNTGIIEGNCRLSSEDSPLIKELGDRLFSVI
ncbi:hypothetical protein KA107_03370 [Candidatus Pacearchaeota archaeon]|nr:hypothetical protein [Candidatus Pacearchaeota archaeon]